MWRVTRRYVESSIIPAPAGKMIFLPQFQAKKKKKTIKEIDGSVLDVLSALPQLEGSWQQSKLNELLVAPRRSLELSDP